MDLIYQDTSLQIAICQLTDDTNSYDFLTESEHDEFSALQHPQRKKEFLTVRFILRKIGITNPIVYNGRSPKLLSDMHISISHNAKYAGIAISETPCGLDIESISERALRVQNKYLTEKEIQLAKDDIMLHNLFWSVKEAVYKWDNSHVDFRETIQILALDKIKQTICVNTNRGEKTLSYRQIDDTDIVSWII
ncbi:MAG: 4'-phosphopantetheinyl transferase superfamily protein [Bacteroidota bacterium]|nr:4'-phosphopantetheinyl transferase superfamily protein [Bacteroidota bacterium]